MNNGSLVHVLIAVYMAIFLSILLLTFYRKTCYLKVYSSSYAFYLLSYLFLAFQTHQNAFITSMASNLFLVAGYLLLFSSIRSFYINGLGWLKRYWVYLVLTGLITYVTTVISYDVIFKNILLGSLTVVIFLDFGFYILGRLNRMNHIVRSAVVISLLVNIITNAIRPVIALTVLTPEDLLADSGGLNMFIFISFIVTSIFWLTTLILLDSSRMLEETKILEGKYRSLIESTDAAIMLIDRQGHLLYMNDIAARPYGKTQEEIIGTNVRDLFTAQWAETVLLDIEQVISSGNGINKEIVYDITGVKQYFRTNIMPIRNESETPYAATISYIDISDIRNAQEQISQSEENYKSLFFESPSGNLIYQDHRIIECNNAVAKMLGGECSQILGLTVGDISPEYQPNGRKSGEFAAEILQDALQTESGFFEWVLKRFDGTEFIVFVNVNAVIYNGQNSVLATWSDITALRKAEEETKKFRTMVEQANYGNAIVSMDGIIIYVNEALSKMHGWDTDELLGRNLTSLHGQEDLERVNFLLEKIKSQGGFAS